MKKKDGNTQGFDQIYYECITMISLKFISSNYQVPHRILNIFWVSNNRSVTLKSPQLHSSLISPPGILVFNGCVYFKWMNF